MAYVINGTYVGDDEIEEEFETLREHYERLGESVCCDREPEIRSYAHTNVVNRVLLTQESVSRFGELGDSEVQARLEAIQAEHGGENAFLDNTGFNAGDLPMIRRRLKHTMVVDRLIEAEVPVEHEPAEEDLQAYYEKNLSHYMTPEEVRVWQIFVEPESHEAARESYQQLRQLRRDLLNGGDFEAAAAEYSTDQERPVDLGFMRQGETMPEIESITFSMNVGEISPVVATHFGFHLFKIVERKEPVPVPRDEIPGFLQQYQSEKRAEGMENLIQSLRERATIEEISQEADPE